MVVQTACAILPVAFTGYVVGGVAHGVKNVLLCSLLTARVPDAVHGRAFAAYNAARNAAEPGGGGALITALGPRTALLLAALGAILPALAGLTALRHRPASAPRPDASRRSALVEP
jgi:sugar phosphate permease